MNVEIIYTKKGQRSLSLRLDTLDEGRQVFSVLTQRASQQFELDRIERSLTLVSVNGGKEHSKVTFIPHG